MITFRAIKPAKPFQSSLYRVEVQTAFKEFSALALMDFVKTTKTWKDPPKFKAELEAGGARATPSGISGVQATIATTDKRYKFVDEGTRVRRAIMSDDFKAKTKPNVIDSGAGRGRVVFISKKISRPGIKARNFTKIIKRRYDPIFRAAINNALAKFARRSGRGAGA